MNRTDPSRHNLGVSPLEWRLQALAAASNALPALAIAAVVGFVSFALGPATGTASWFIGGIVIAFVSFYALVCLTIGTGLWLRMRRARWPGAAIFVLYISLYLWVSSLKPPAHSQAPEPVRGQTYVPPAWFTTTRFALSFLLRLVLLVNAVALTHLLLRWRRFSQSDP